MWIATHGLPSNWEPPLSSILSSPISHGTTWWYGFLHYMHTCIPLEM
jgi:hypothetical protein